MFLKVGFMIFIARGVLISRSDKPMSEKVLKYLDNDDAEGLKSIFCEKMIAQTPDLDKQIEVD